MKQINTVMNATEFAAFAKVSAGTVTAWLEEKMPAKRTARSGAEVQIDIRKAVPWLAKRHRDRQGADFERIQRARAEKFELENARRRGELALVTDVEAMLGSMAAELVSRLESLPGRVAGEFAGTSDAAQIRMRLLEECRSIRSALANNVAQMKGPGETARKKAKA